MDLLVFSMRRLLSSRACRVNGPSVAFCVMAIMIVAPAQSEEGKAKEAIKPEPNVVYQCRQDGVEVFTNTRLNKNCKVTKLSQVVKSAVASPAPTSPAAAGGAFPKVSEAAQKARDTDRRRILEEELTSEQKNLDAAKKELTAQEATAAKEEKNYQKILERLQPFKDKVSQHERNLLALRKELSGLPK